MRREHIDLRNEKKSNVKLHDELIKHKSYFFVIFSGNKARNKSRNMDAVCKINLSTVLRCRLH
jgi:hypothetical protein